MYISGIQYESIVDGEGLRTTLFISGCKWNCKDCHNIKTHSFTYGKTFNNKLQNEVISYIKNNPMIKGITLSGGDPMFSASDLLEFVETLKLEIPYINIWCYSGFTYEDIIEDNDDKYNLLKMCDVLVDGLFDISLKDIRLCYRGSSNQRIIDVQESLNQNKIILYLE
jgi:anaerobic ribonucleoside-triphosphate reductase activating protein